MRKIIILILILFSLNFQCMPRNACEKSEAPYGKIQSCVPAHTPSPWTRTYRTVSLPCLLENFMCKPTNTTDPFLVDTEKRAHRKKRRRLVGSLCHTRSVSFLYSQEMCTDPMMGGRLIILTIIYTVNVYIYMSSRSLSTGNN